MDSIKEFEIKITKIADYAFSFGTQFLQIIGKGKEISQDFIKKHNELFLTACYGGQKLAQDLLLKEIIYYQNILRDTKDNLKEARRKRDKVLENMLLALINQTEYRLKILAHIADSIAWILIRGQIHIARRLFMGDEGVKFLDSNNLQSLIVVAQKINKEPLKIALISDITSYIQVGDLLIVNPEGFQLAEVKEGKVNVEILEVFNLYQNFDIENINKTVFDNIEESKLKQIKRMLRQHKRASDVMEVIKNDEGFDPKFDRSIKVLTPSVRTVKYYDIIDKLVKVLESQVSAYTCIDDCLHIGIYRDEGLALAEGEIETLISKNTPNYYMFDWLSIISQVSEPIFTKPLPKPFIFDVLLNRIKVIIGLDLDAFINTCNRNGTPARWMSKKETAQVSQMGSSKFLVIKNGRGIAINTGEKSEDIVLGGGVISKMIFDNIYPSNIILSLIQ